jgi:hypothetical protein
MPAPLGEEAQRQIDNRMRVALALGFPSAKEQREAPWYSNFQGDYSDIRTRQRSALAQAQALQEAGKVNFADSASVESLLREIARNTAKTATTAPATH